MLLRFSLKRRKIDDSDSHQHQKTSEYQNPAEPHLPFRQRISEQKISQYARHHRTEKDDKIHHDQPQMLYNKKCQSHADNQSVCSGKQQNQLNGTP